LAHAEQVVLVEAPVAAELVPVGQPVQALCPVVLT
jgi:hypothetical protein